jgi:hypothetical protein
VFVLLLAEQLPSPMAAVGTIRAKIKTIAITIVNICLGDSFLLSVCLSTVEALLTTVAFFLALLPLLLFLFWFF